jgi:hypothetical protein
MSVILGSLTRVQVYGPGGTYRDTGFQSVSWNIDRQPNRLWQLGSWNPWKTQVGATVSISITAYAEAMYPFDPLTPATACTDSTAVRRIAILADACAGGQQVNLNYDHMYLNSYSYSKGDPTGFATESWSFQKWINPNISDPTNSFIIIPVPTLVLQGRSEGSRSGDVGNGTTDLGIRFVGEPGSPGGYPYAAHVVSGDQGNVSAGFPGQGEATTTYMGLVDKAGGGKLEAGGKIGQSSVTIPHSPLYLG